MTTILHRLPSSVPRKSLLLFFVWTLRASAHFLNPSGNSLFDRNDQLPLCILSWGPVNFNYLGPQCNNDINEHGCVCANSMFDCENFFNAVTCQGEGKLGTCVLRTNGEPMCAKPIEEACRPCNVKDDCPGFQQCVFIGEPYRTLCTNDESMSCGNQVCMDFHTI